MDVNYKHAKLFLEMKFLKKSETIIARNMISKSISINLLIKRIIVLFSQIMNNIMLHCILNNNHQPDSDLIHNHSYWKIFIYKVNNFRILQISNKKKVKYLLLNNRNIT